MGIQSMRMESERLLTLVILQAIKSAKQRASLISVLGEHFDDPDANWQGLSAVFESQNLSKFIPTGLDPDSSITNSEGIVTAFQVDVSPSACHAMYAMANAAGLLPDPSGMEVPADLEAVEPADVGRINAAVLKWQLCGGIYEIVRGIEASLVATWTAATADSVFALRTTPGKLAFFCDLDAWHGGLWHWGQDGSYAYFNDDLMGLLPFPVSTPVFAGRITAIPRQWAEANLSGILDAVRSLSPEKLWALGTIPELEFSAVETQEIALGDIDTGGGYGQANFFLLQSGAGCPVAFSEFDRDGAFADAQNWSLLTRGGRLYPSDVAEGVGHCKTPNADLEGLTNGSFTAEFRRVRVVT